MGHAFATVALGPLLLVQGKLARARTPLLPEPPGARRGTLGQGPPLRLLVVGDSSAAGVGAEHQDDALLGRIVEALATERSVSWHLEARTGATTPGTLRHLARLDPEPFDVAVTSLGVNDVVNGVRRDAWLEDQRRLRQVLRERFGVRRLVVSGFPPVHGFPALPQPLRWYLGRRCRELDRAIESELLAESDADFLPVGFDMDVTAMASDGFHPGPQVYAAWGRGVAELILDSPVI